MTSTVAKGATAAGTTANTADSGSGEALKHLVRDESRGRKGDVLLPALRAHRLQGWTANPVQRTGYLGVKLRSFVDAVDGGNPSMIAAGIGTILI